MQGNKHKMRPTLLGRNRTGSGQGPNVSAELSSAISRQHNKSAAQQGGGTRRRFCEVGDVFNGDSGR